jgi:hypothetical protein
MSLLAGSVNSTVSLLGISTASVAKVTGQYMNRMSTQTNFIIDFLSA